MSILFRPWKKAKISEQKEERMISTTGLFLHRAKPVFESYAPILVAAGVPWRTFQSSRGAGRDFWTIKTDSQSHQTPKFSSCLSDWFSNSRLYKIYIPGLRVNSDERLEARSFCDFKICLKYYLFKKKKKFQINNFIQLCDFSCVWVCIVIHS